MTTQPPEGEDRPTPWTPPRDDPEPYAEGGGLTGGGATRYTDRPEPVYGPPPPVQYGQPQHPSVYVQAGPPRPPTNGLATAGGVCGIVGAAISWIPVINFFSFVLAILAVAMGGVGLSRANKMDRDGFGPVGRGMAITGIVLGALGLVVAILIIAAVGSALSTPNT